MRKLFPLFGLLGATALLWAAPATAQDKTPQPVGNLKLRVGPAPAQAVLDAAMKTAKREKKPIFLHFGASWCGWCKELEATLDDPEFKRIFEDNYVVVGLVVQESKEKKALENPGADKMKVDLGGENAGLPFFAALNAKGEKLANSNLMPREQNVGFPATPEEIATFEKFLKDTAPRLKDADRAKLIEIIKKRNIERAKKQNKGK